MEKAISVSEVNSIIKTLIDEHAELSGIYVRGELSNYKVYASGHHYFSMKDSTGVLRCVMFRGAASQLDFKPENGMEVIALGKVSVFVRDGAYQLYVEKLIPAGAGALNIEFERLKKELGAQGLFDQEHKKPLPKYPNRIGVVTSGSGAAFHDILRVTSGRWPMAKIIIFPVQVQGRNAGLGISRAIDYADKWKMADVLIVGRGGGSMEDLWCFNDPRVAYSIFNAETPIISAVGHEPDVTIADYVADARAATPSNGAEIAVPDRRDVLRHISQLRQKMDQDMSLAISNERSKLKLFAPQSPLASIREGQMNLDRMLTHLDRNIDQEIVRHKLILANVEKRPEFSSPLKIVNDAKSRLNFDLRNKMDFAIKSSFNNEREHLATLDKSLHFNHPLVRLREARVRNTACGQRMDVVINAALVNKRNQFNLISICPPKIETARQELDVKNLALNEAIHVQILREKNSLQVAELKLKTLDPLKPLEQGFAYAYHDGGSAVTSVNAVTSGDVIHVQVADGVIDCVVQ